MKRPLETLKSALVTGLIIVVPAWLALLLLVKLLVQLDVLVKPISRELPKSVDHPQIIAGLVFILICLLVGLLVHTAFGRVIGKTLGENVFNRVPGYQSLRNIARQFADMDARDGFKPSLIEIEDGCLAPAFLIEVHPDGNSTVFMPSVPTPMAGSKRARPSDRRPGDHDDEVHLQMGLGIRRAHRRAGKTPAPSETDAMKDTALLLALEPVPHSPPKPLPMNPETKTRPMNTNWIRVGELLRHFTEASREEERANAGSTVAARLQQRIEGLEEELKFLEQGLPVKARSWSCRPTWIGIGKSAIVAFRIGKRLPSGYR